MQIDLGCSIDDEDADTLTTTEEVIMEAHSWTAGGQASPKRKGIGNRSITTDSTVNVPLVAKITDNGNGPRKAY